MNGILQSNLLNMRITFVYPDLATDDPTYTGYFHHGIASLSAVLKKAGHRTSLIQLLKKISEEEFQEKVKALNPDLIGFSSTAHVFPFVKKYAKAAKKVTSAPIICGGVHPTVCPEEVIKDESIDMICRGEGDLAMVELCQKMESGQPIENVKNIWLKKGERIFRNELRALITNLDELPFPDREIYDYPLLNLEKRGIGTFMFSRGCPYQCTFCCESTLRKLYSNSQYYHRTRSPRTVIAEIKETVKKYPFIKFVRFDDDLLFVRKDWVKEFVPLYKKEINLPFSSDIRVNLMTENLLSLLKEAGGYLLRIGVESGDDFILKEVLNKGITVEQIKKAFKTARQKGFKTQAYNMVGLPGEGPKEILETIKLNAEINPNLSVVSIFYPYKGTFLYELCVQKRYLKEEDAEVPQNYYSYSVLSLPTIGREQISFFFHYFHLLKKFYSFLFKIPFSRPLVFLADKILSFRYAPELINAIFNPLRVMKRKVFKILKKEVKQDTEAISK
ncbi:hypothetical protein COS93_00460 [bacterium (Candidatus Gribaldobacteria) CG07_land_8_20_14_0_80_33_18]|uniref:Uncharacterized protein n=1 Tax=bacterium (Candidatus Gribaldobacteria) CG07_land_8_20_14_0_80_33_18 TaxID=2014272 RepID=A0A2M6Z4E2_9BACT|nr:MAG: hypothetical protein COU04_01575 [bacterium (Candidatus Gribaldobacteria) CG10_big_fil_rev_8_21_14_0_10_33_41]PIU47205.1 MAG: hypothetical protein COS93_00460 [bacterium (Candidatus Gribaldobacteria) CG07_land_8_20_14_0_80_33_18]PJA00965.1 MAG: hypothetical protein COX75_01235 [bacterium (Candidatus Gribaldobacteria) CG_4_10_14_0_2_um_filter_33_15]PJB08583.1 MAG: hypothetical protein CO122_01470 [bacterium (Candidatus Gribaldobacteria) CG_4_9_14_3_um_filter_33_9]